MVSANKKARSQLEGVYSSTEGQMLLAQQNVNAHTAQVILEEQWEATESKTESRWFYKFWEF